MIQSPTTNLAKRAPSMPRGRQSTSSTHALWRSAANLARVGPVIIRFGKIGTYFDHVNMASATKHSIQNTQYSMPPITHIHFLVTL